MDRSPEEPTPWQIEVLLRENIREAQQRMEHDVLRFGLLTVLYLVLAFAHADEISAVGIKITQPQYAQFAIAPYGMFVALRFLKAQAVRDAVYGELRDRGSLAPRAAAVLDWSLSGDRARQYRRHTGAQGWVTPTMMLVAVMASHIYNFIDADSGHSLVWAGLCFIAGVGLLALMGAGRAAWDRAFYWPE